jgi:hypothetical protein
MTLRDHLISRGMDVDRYQVILDEDEYIATFLLFNASGQFTGYQRYNPRSTDKKANDPETGRYYTYTPRGVDAILGLETLRFSGGTPLFVVEGAFKQATLCRLGYDSIAVLTSDPKRMRPLFRILRSTRPVVGIGDADPAGARLVRRVGAGACSPRDLDEMADEEVHAFVDDLIHVA